ncbi:caspase, EACC1-associated type [Pedococcus soli]
MDGRRTALIVASDEFEHTGLSRLQAPAADEEALAAVLGDPQVGGFEVRVVHNAPSHAVQAQVEDLFAEGRPEDLLLLHFSGHGLKSDSGELFLAATNTRPDRLASTAVSADFVQRCMRGSRARSIVLFLDCCYGGAFGEGVAVRAAGPANVLDSFPAGKLGGGRGRAVITASSAMEYAFEGSALATDDQVQPSVFTAALVQGLSTGAADRDEDGLVSLNELYDYVFDQVRAQNPNQTPSRDIELQGELYVARSRRKRVRAVPLPPDLRAAVEDDNMYTRLGAVGELRARLANVDPGVSLGAREALEAIARSDTSYVADAARAALDPGHPTVPTPVTETVTESPPRDDSRPEDTAPPATPARAPAAPRTERRAATARATPSPAPLATPSATPVVTGSVTPVVTGSVAESAGSAAHDPRAARQRVSAGRTALTGGALTLLSALLPYFVRGDDAHAFDPRLSTVLLVVGAVGIVVALGTLYLRALFAPWRWVVSAAAVAAAVALVMILDVSSDLGSSEVDVGIWVALAGCLTTLAGGVTALLGRLRAPGGAGTGPSPAAPSPRARAVGRAAVVSSGSAIVATFAVRFTGGTQALVEPDLVWAWLFPGFVGLAGGILTLRLHRWTHVGPALVTGAATAALWGVWDLPRIWHAEGTANLGAGFFLEFGGLIGLVVVGAGALVILRREHSLVVAPPAWSSAALTGVVGLLAAVPFVRVAAANVGSSQPGNAAHDIEMIVLVVLAPLLTTVVRPSVLGRLLLVGWSFAAAGTVVAYWRLLRRGGFPLYGVPYALLALAAFVVIAVAVRPGGEDPPVENQEQDRPPD